MPGNRVRARYLNGTGATLDISLTDQANDPEHGLISSAESLGAALLGAEDGEEAEFLVGNYVGRALVERVTGAQSRGHRLLTINLGLSSNSLRETSRCFSPDGYLHDSCVRSKINGAEHRIAGFVFF
jgi:hypothetical protein